MAYMNPSVKSGMCAINYKISDKVSFFNILNLQPQIEKNIIGHEANLFFRSSVAYAISAIAHWDWPENWCGLFDLLMAALKTGEEAPVHGAMRVLTEFSRDLTDQHIPQVAPVILPEMYRIFCEEEVRFYSPCVKGI